MKSVKVDASRLENYCCEIIKMSVSMHITQFLESIKFHMLEFCNFNAQVAKNEYTLAQNDGIFSKFEVCVVL